MSESEDFLKQFRRTDSEKQAQEIDSSEHIFNVLLAVTNKFDIELKKRFSEKRIEKNPDDEKSKQLRDAYVAILILEKDLEKEEELSRIQEEVDKRRREIKDRYRNSLLALESVQKDSESKLTSTDITNVKYSAKIVLDEDIKKLEEWMADTLSKF